MSCFDFIIEICFYDEIKRHLLKLLVKYIRGGDSDANIKFAKKSGVKHVGIAPRGKRSWPVSEKMAEQIRCERAQVEGSIGTIKSSRYGFTKPRAFSTAALERCGHREQVEMIC